VIDVSRMLPFATAGCIGAKVHRPKPLITEQHHIFPVYLQARVWSDVDPARPATAHTKDKVMLCGNCHATVHMVLDALLRDEVPPKAPRKLVAIAKSGWDIYRAATGK